MQFPRHLSRSARAVLIACLGLILVVATSQPASASVWQYRRTFAGLTGMASFYQSDSCTVRQEMVSAQRLDGKWTLYDSSVYIDFCAGGDWTYAEGSVEPSFVSYKPDLDSLTVSGAVPMSDGSTRNVAVTILGRGDIERPRASTTIYAVPGAQVLVQAGAGKARSATASGTLNGTPVTADMAAFWQTSEITLITEITR